MLPSESCVFFDQIDTVSWEKKQLPKLGGPGIAEIWRIHLPSSMDRITELYQILSFEEKNKASRFYQEKDRHRFIIGKAILKIFLARHLNIHPQTINFTYELYKKPVLKVGDQIPVHFNVSHSGDYVLIAFADKPIGVDIEYIDRNLDINEIMNVAFSNAEIVFMTQQTTCMELFFQLWARKEALLKAASKGLNNDIKYMPSLNGKHFVQSELLNGNERWRVTSFNVDEKHVASIAYPASILQVQFNQLVYSPSYDHV
jgi:4'-phosphopantetheinyl transferase